MVTFGRPQMSSMTSDGIPQLHFNQLNVIAQPSSPCDQNW
jgi:hypothetical protein